MFVIPHEMFQPFSKNTSECCLPSAIEIGWEHPFEILYSGYNLEWAIANAQENFMSFWVLKFESLEGLTQGNLNWLANNLFAIAPDGVNVEMSVSWTPNTQQVIILSEIDLAQMMFSIAIEELEGIIYG